MSQSAFISYSAHDLQAAREVEAALRALDLETPEAVRARSTPGSPEAIGRTISSADLLVLLWSEKAAQSRLVEFEWNAAIALRKTIALCLLDETPLSPALAGLPGVTLSQFRDSIPPILAAASRSPDDEDTTRRVLDRLRTIPPGDLDSMAETGTLLLRAFQLADSEQTPVEPIRPPLPEQDDFETGTVILRAGGELDTGADHTPAARVDPGTVIFERKPEGPATASTGSPSGENVLSEGMTLGNRYQIRKLLGQGGMGSVYRAHDLELDREVALKVIKPEIARNPEILERFKREIQLSSVVTHRNVLRVYDLGEAGGVRFLTMQFVEGENLFDLVRREGRLPLERALQIFRQTCEGLRAAHEQGVIHRDLKPDNVMLDGTGQVLLTDFGLAKSMQQSGMTQAGQVMGTPDYMSPEQVRGDEVDNRSDIYSLGAMLYEMVTGRVPFRGNTVFEVMIQRTQREPESVTSINPGVPPFLEHIIDRCMAREKEARYASIDELLVDLDHGMETGKASFGGRFLLRRLGALQRTIGWRRLLLGVVLLSLLAAGAVSLLQRAGIIQGPAPGVVPAAVEPLSLLIADFVNTTGETVFNGTVEQAMSIGLEGASFVESFRRERARSIATELKPDLQSLDLDAARLVAQRVGIAAVVTGRIEGAGGAYTVSAEAIDPLSGDSLARGQARAGSRETVLEAVGKVAADIRRDLGDRASEAEMRTSIETFTTSSLEAAQAYAGAQRLQQQGKWQEAIERYQVAVEIDPNMGRAYSGLAVMNFNLGNHEEADRYFLISMSQLDRMTPRERYRTQGNYYILKRDYEKAVEAYTSLVEQVPGDSLGRANLAYAAFFARDFQDAFEQGKRIADANPANVVMRANSAWYAMFAGDFETAAAEALKSLELDDTFRQTYLYLALTELARGKVDEARQAWERLEGQGAEGASMAAAGLADLAFYQGRFRDAIRILEADLATEQPSLPGLKKTAKAMAHLELGETGAATRAADEAVEVTGKLGVLFEAGLVHLRAGNRERGLQLAARLSSSLQIEDQAYGRLLEGESRRLEGNVQEAVRLFRESQNQADTIIGRFLLGLAYLDGGAFPSAYSEFEQCLNRRGELTSIFLDEAPTYRYFPPVHYYMGRVQEALGSPAAADSFRAFLDIRGQGDPDTRVDEARAKTPSG